MAMTISQDLFEKSQKVIPGGVNSPVRAFGSVGRTPVFMKKAKGSHIFDEDGNSYVDYVCSWGPGILGHADDRVIDAVKAACDDGLTFGAPTRKELEIAELINELMPSMELTRMVNSGTEAVMSALRVARGFTGRDKIVKFRGCYHGHSDGLLVKAGSAALTQSVPDSLGVPKSYTQHTLIAEYNNEDSVKKLFEAEGKDIAAIVVEPVAANMGVVITGFRLSLGGAQEYFGVKPDLTTLGKIVGGGMPVGAYGGRRDVMSMVAPLGGVYQAGTLSGNPIAMTAGLTTLRILQKEKDTIYPAIEKSPRQIADTVRNTFGEAVHVNQIGSLMSVFFTEQEVVDMDTSISSDTARYAKYFSYMLDNGIYLAPSQFEAMFVSYAHSKEDVSKTCELIKKYKEN